MATAATAASPVSGWYPPPCREGASQVVPQQPRRVTATATQRRRCGPPPVCNRRCSRATDPTSRQHTRSRGAEIEAAHCPAVRQRRRRHQAHRRGPRNRMRRAAAIAARFHTMARPAEHEFLFTGAFRLDRTRLAAGLPRASVAATVTADALASAGAATRTLVVHSGNPALRGGGTALLSAPLGPTLAALGVAPVDALAATSPAATAIVLGVHEVDGATWVIVDASGGGTEAEVAAALTAVAGEGGGAITFTNARDLFFGAMARGATVAPGVRQHSDGAAAGGSGGGMGAGATGEWWRSDGRPRTRHERRGCGVVRNTACSRVRTVAAMATAANVRRGMVASGGCRSRGARGGYEWMAPPAPRPQSPSPLRSRPRAPRSWALRRTPSRIDANTATHPTPADGAGAVTAIVAAALR